MDIDYPCPEDHCYYCGEDFEPTYNHKCTLIDQDKKYEQG
jgi:hypothetical protein